jgi:hypothetical protein
MGQLHSRTGTAPAAERELPAVERLGEDLEVRGLARLDVALKVAFERQTLKPIFYLIGYRLWV